MRLGQGLSLLVGGARSGKSDLAVRLGEAWPGEVTFVATATAGDADMAARIERHKHERPAGWRLVESPLFAAVDAEAMNADDLIVVDCLTLLVANLMFDAQPEDEIVTHVEKLSAALAVRSTPSIVISNEVGLGVHPETELGRAYRDILGRANRSVASAAETSLLVVAGNVLPLKSLDITW